MRISIALGLVALLFGVTGVAQDRSARVSVREMSYTQLDGTTNHATLVSPATPAGTRAPAILFVHWYEPPKPSSNRTEFLPDAVELGAAGAISLLIDTPWATENWFPKRDGERDYAFSVQQVKELRKALDVLLARPGIDKTRVAYVGHDFGAMYGALAVAEDARVTHFVYMAGTRSFSDWFLFTPKREGAERDAFIAKLAPLDPIAYLAKIGPRPVLLQFGTKDRFVSPDAAAAQAGAVTGPKTVKTYEGAEHELTNEARRDRVEWLKQQLRLH
jgi:pimeloyl-ACP methyl ester carboxylesterase